MNFEVRIPDPNADSPEFYMENGLKHCPLCHTPMETWVILGATRKTVSCLCQCRPKPATNVTRRLRPVRKQSVRKSEKHPIFTTPPCAE